MSAKLQFDLEFGFSPSEEKAFVEPAVTVSRNIQGYKMKNRLIIAMMLLATTMVSASPGWIGNGLGTAAGNPLKATAQWIRQDNNNLAKFKIVEFSAEVPAGTVFGFDGTTPAGKNILELLMTAYTMKSNIIFNEVGTNSNGTKSFDNLSIGNDN